MLHTTADDWEGDEPVLMFCHQCKAIAVEAFRVEEYSLVGTGEFTFYLPAKGEHNEENGTQRSWQTRLRLDQNRFEHGRAKTMTLFWRRVIWH